MKWRSHAFLIIKFGVESKNGSSHTFSFFSLPFASPPKNEKVKDRLFARNLTQTADLSNQRGSGFLYKRVDWIKWMSFNC